MKMGRTRIVFIAAAFILLVGAVAWRSAFHVSKAADAAKAGPATNEPAETAPSITSRLMAATEWQWVVMGLSDL